MESSAPNSHQIGKFLMAATTSALLLVLSGLTFTGTVISLVVATPVLMLFSPVLVPAGILISLVVSGFFFSGGFVVAALSPVSWIWNYVSGNHQARSDQLDNAHMRVAEKVEEEKEMMKENRQEEQNKAEEAKQEEEKNKPEEHKQEEQSKAEEPKQEENKKEQAKQEE